MLRLTLVMALALASTAGAQPRPNAATRLPAPERMLFWSPDEQEIAFKSFDRLYASRPVAAGQVVRALPAGKPLDVAFTVAGVTYDVDAFMRDNRVFGLLVLKDGQVRAEKYAHGLKSTDRWTSYSVVKSMTSTLVGAALKEGKIRNLDEPVTNYVRALKGTGYEGVTIRQALNMSTGVRWDENYLDPNADINALVRLLAERRAGGLTRYVATSPKAWEPDRKFDYNTGATHVLGEVVAAATGQRLSSYLSEKVWRPAGMEADAAWTSDGGQEFAGCCLNARLRDFGRFGLFAMNDFRGADGVSIVPDGWLQEARKGSPASSGYGYQWWITSEKAFSAIGVFGQMIFIDPDQKLVVVLLSAFPTPSERAYAARSRAFVAAVSAAVAVE